MIPARYYGGVKNTKIDQRKVTRFAICGAIAFGLSGFATGSFICLYYSLPIPPLFITEMGLIVGGCLGALCALTNSEKRVLTALAAVLLSVPICLLVGLSTGASATLVLALGAAGWTLAEPVGSEEEAWKNI